MKNTDHLTEQSQQARALVDAIRRDIQPPGVLDFELSIESVRTRDTDNMFAFRCNGHLQGMFLCAHGKTLAEMREHWVSQLPTPESRTALAGDLRRQIAALEATT